MAPFKCFAFLGGFTVHVMLMLVRREHTKMYGSVFTVVSFGREENILDLHSCQPKRFSYNAAFA